MNFREFRNLELSTIEYLTSEINTNWNNSVIVEKSFTQAKSRWTTKQPVVCIRLRDITPIREEVGSTNYRYIVEIVIDIFGTSDGNRLDLAAQITESLKATWDYKTYSKDSDGFNGIDSGDNMRVFEWYQNSRLEFGDEVSAADKFRHVMALSVGVT